MKRLVLILILTFFSSYIWCKSISQKQDTISLMTYNALWFSGNTDDMERVKYFRKIIGSLKPDLICLQEMANQDGAQIFYDSVMYVIDKKYSYSPFSEIKSNINDNILYYNSEKVTYLHTKLINTDCRDIAAYYISLKESVHKTKLIIASTHLKASNGSTDKKRRWLEVKEYQKFVDTLSCDYPLIFVGDLNLYTAEEPAYKLLLDSLRVKLQDPLDARGNWHDNSYYAWLHTQSTRSYCSGFNYGGLDDRFDFILMSHHFFDSNYIQYVENSYIAFGNDGYHFNKPINVEPFTGFGRNKSIADALFYASDHLPVIAKFCYPTGSIVENNEPIARKISLVAYPNPFNSTTRIRATLPEPGRYKLSIFNLRGEKVFSKTLYSNINGDIKEVVWESTLRDGKNIPAGIYFIKISNNKGLGIVRKIICLK